MRPLRPIFIASFFFTFHLALLSFLNSTVLASHGSALQTTLAYTIASTLSLVLIILAPHIVQRTGASRFLLTTLALSTIFLGLLGSVAAHAGFITIFIVYFALNTVTWYAFDLVIEHYSRQEVTGNIRGIYLTFGNMAWVIAPLASSALIAHMGFVGVYSIAGVCMLISAILIKSTPRITIHTHVPKTSIFEAFSALVAHKQARRIVTLYFTLQFFFALMVLYMAPYLLSLGFSWSTIGIIFSVMLLPFILFQYWTGKYADRHHAERGLLITGFCITAVATLLLALRLPVVAALFAAILFLTRVGASIIEVACESAFFKEVSEKDTALIGTLRMTLPLAYIIAPLIGAFILWIGSMHTLFVFLACIMASAMLYALRLTKRQYHTLRDFS